MKRKLFTLFIICCTSLCAQRAKAQQEAMYSQYMFNMLALNPAYAGTRDVIAATAMYRRQWVGIDGAPQTSTLSVDAPITGKNIGLGLQLVNDQIGITKSTGFFGSYAYKIHGRKGTLSIGLQAGGTQFKANFAGVETGEAQDPAFKQYVNKFFVNFGAGAFYYTDKWYAGVSLPTLIDNQREINNRIHLFVTGGYVFTLSEALKLKAATLIKAVEGAPVEADISANLWIKDLVSGGFMYRTNADFSIMAEVRVSPSFQIGYDYDRSTTRLGEFNSGTHEIMVRFQFGTEKNKVLSPRYF